jgi:hypothetical protein
MRGKGFQPVFVVQRRPGRVGNEGHGFGTREGPRGRHQSRPARRTAATKELAHRGLLVQRVEILEAHVITKERKARKDRRKTRALRASRPLR